MQCLVNANNEDTISIAVLSTMANPLWDVIHVKSHATIDNTRYIVTNVAINVMITDFIGFNF